MDSEESAWIICVWWEGAVEERVGHERKQEEPRGRASVPLVGEARWRRRDHEKGLKRATNEVFIDARCTYGDLQRRQEPTSLPSALHALHFQRGRSLGTFFLSKFS